jgi:hypothetical protein
MSNRPPGADLGPPGKGRWGPFEGAPRRAAPTSHCGSGAEHPWDCPTSRDPANQSGRGARDTTRGPGADVARSWRRRGQVLAQTWLGPAQTWLACSRRRLLQCCSLAGLDLTELVTKGYASTRSPSCCVPLLRCVCLFVCLFSGCAISRRRCAASHRPRALQAALLPERSCAQLQRGLSAAGSGTTRATFCSPVSERGRHLRP